MHGFSGRSLTYTVFSVKIKENGTRMVTERWVDDLLWTPESKGHYAINHACGKHLNM